MGRSSQPHGQVSGHSALGERLFGAGILLVVVSVVVGLGWLASIGLYAMGLWPLGALLRVAVWGFALFGLYRAVRYLVESPGSSRAQAG